MKLGHSGVGMSVDIGRGPGMSPGACQHLTVGQRSGQKPSEKLLEESNHLGRVLPARSSTGDLSQDRGTVQPRGHGSMIEGSLGEGWDLSRLRKK